MRSLGLSHLGLSENRFAEESPSDIPGTASAGSELLSDPLDVGEKV